MDCACISILLEFGNALGDANSRVSQWCHMRPALTIRLTDELLAWLKEMSRRTGLRGDGLFAIGLNPPRREKEITDSETSRARLTGHRICLRRKASPSMKPS